MQLTMVGIDHTTADVAAREAFSFTSQRRREALTGLLARGGLSGCVLLSTCNRCELYLSHRDERPDGVPLLCLVLGLDHAAFRDHFVERRGKEAAVHLMRVAAGMRSSIPGDDQIITQVREAMESAREAKTADPSLETLFRCAITSGKRIKTSIRFAREGGSVAAQAVLAAERALGGLSGRSALVIGNGVVGRSAARALLERGCRVTMTLRSRKHGGPSIPDGCSAVDYEDRYRAMDGCDLLLSATASPHLAVVAGKLLDLAAPPRLMLDLAIPRDISPDVAEAVGVTLLNVDDIHPAMPGVEQSQIAAAEGVIAEEYARFARWRREKQRLDPARGTPDFPLFVNMRDVAALVVGGGPVAARRTAALLDFGARVRVVSPLLAPEMRRLLDRGNLEWLEKEYDGEDLDGVFLAVAAAGGREINRRVGRDARKLGIWVSVADRREECTFYFPALFRGGNLAAGLVSDNGDHGLVSRAAAAMRECLAKISEDPEGGQPGQ